MDSSCSRCGAPRVLDAAQCRRCGLSWVQPPVKSTGAALVLTQVAPQAGAGIWEVADTPLQIGRLESPILLSERTVSRRHARVSRTDDGYILEDLASASGTFVNDHRITTPTLLHDGDRLTFGDVVLVAEIRYPAAVARHTPTATLMYAAEAVQPRTQPAATEPRAAVVDVTLAEQPAVSEAMAEPTPSARRRQATAPLSSQPVAPQTRLSAGAYPVARPLAAMRQAADGVAGSLRRFEDDTVPILASFDQCGGLPALQALLARARRMHANQLSPIDPADGMDWLPAVCRFLEIELALVHVLTSGEASHARV